MSITRARVMLRTKYGWPRKNVSFEPTVFNRPDGYRRDAAGYVSMCWDIPLNAPRSYGGMTTVTLLTDGWASEIKPAELEAGDAVGYLGPDSVDADGGLILIFERWLDRAQGIAMTWEFHKGVNPGPDLRLRPINFQWHAYRFKDIVDE